MITTQAVHKLDACEKRVFPPVRTAASRKAWRIFIEFETSFRYQSTMIFLIFNAYFRVHRNVRDLTYQLEHILRCNIILYNERQHNH